MRQSVIVDRCNFDAKQRQHWVELGQRYSADAVLCIVMHSTAVNVCSQRAIARGDDGIHKDGDKTNWSRVCTIMRDDFRFPALHEGLQGVYKCTGDDSGADAEAVASALRRWVAVVL
jgi:hypothetical protein